MSISTLPLLIKNIYRTNQTGHVANLLNRYNGLDWMEYMNYSKYPAIHSFCLYKNYNISLHLLGISKQSTFSLDNNHIHHIKILDGKLKVLPISETIGSSTETFHFDNKQQHWLQNNFAEHSCALLFSNKQL